MKFLVTDKGWTPSFRREVPNTLQSRKESEKDPDSQKILVGFYRLDKIPGVFWQDTKYSDYLSNTPRSGIQDPAKFYDEIRFQRFW